MRPINFETSPGSRTESYHMRKKTEFCIEFIIENLFLCVQINDYDFEFQQLVAQQYFWDSW